MYAFHSHLVPIESCRDEYQFRVELSQRGENGVRPGRSKLFRSGPWLQRTIDDIALRVAPGLATLRGLARVGVARMLVRRREEKVLVPFKPFLCT